MKCWVKNILCCHNLVDFW